MRREGLTLALTLTVGISLGVIGNQLLNVQQQTPPTTEKDRTTKTVASLDVGPQIPEYQGRHLRARVVAY